MHQINMLTPYEIQEGQKQIQDYLKIIEKQPRNSSALQKLGQLCYKLGDHLNGQKFLTQAYDINDEDFPEFAENRRLYQNKMKQFLARKQ